MLHEKLTFPRGQFQSVYYKQYQQVLEKRIVSPPEDDTICNLLQLSKFSPSFNKHSTSIFTGYDYEHVVYWITVFFLKSIHGLAYK